MVKKNRHYFFSHNKVIYYLPFSLYKGEGVGTLPPPCKLASEEVSAVFGMGEEGVARPVVRFLLPSPPSGLNVQILVCSYVEKDGKNMGEAWKMLGFASLMSVISATI